MLGNDIWPFSEVTSVGNPSHGTAVKDGGKIKYTPDAGFYGEDKFDYYLGINLAKATVKVTVREPRAVANDDSASMSYDDNSTVIDVLANDTGPYTGIKSIGELSHGSAEKYRGQIKYTPEKGYYGQDSFVYKLSQPSDYKTKPQATVNVTVREPVKLNQTQKNATNSQAVSDYTDTSGNVKTLSQTDIGNETPMTAIDFSTYEQSYDIMAADKDLTETKRDTYASISNKFDTLQDLRQNIANGKDKITEFNNTLQDVINQIQNL